ncbi:calcitonin/calcitonin-related polypeptide, alpha isoform X1 [Xiphophorus couchianus]|uniref:calcitonin/calcitonin-related polypeptide, alpha isoform X1 n=1 Tax=Xiphophorus couchianus TaxID=32473 RepID=UPI001016D758|nr:calcitonin gene-related peptide-like isoform X1 [Xiphophorus couchianus]
MWDIYKALHCEKAQQIHKSPHRLRLQTIYNHKGIMSMLKLRTLLLGYALFFCQTFSNAAPSSKESMSDGVTLLNKDAEMLLRAIKEFMQITSDEPAKQPADGESNSTAQKRACNTATCVTHRLADFLSRSGGLGHSNFVPTNVGAQAFGRRKRHGLMQDQIHAQ